MSFEIKKEPEEPKNEEPDDKVYIELMLAPEEVDIKPDIVKLEVGYEPDNLEKNSNEYDAAVKDSRIMVKIEPEAYLENQCDDVAEDEEEKKGEEDKKRVTRSARNPQKRVAPAGKKSTKKIKVEEQSVTLTKKQEKKKKELEKRQGLKSVDTHFSIVIITENQRLEENARILTYLDSEYICNGCALGFKSKDDFFEHNKLHEPRSTEAAKFLCDVCNTYRQSRDALFYHKRDHYRRYRCDPCDIVYRDKEAAYQHLISTHPKKTNKKKEGRTKKCQPSYVCSVCNNRYKCENYLRQHIARVHEKSGQWLACHCGRVFPTRSRLTEHELNIHADASLECACDHCGKTFKNKSLLNRHKTIHTGQTYPCTECGAEFKTKGYVQIHYKTKHMNMTRKEIKQHTKKYKPMWIHDVTQDKIKFVESDPEKAASAVKALMEASAKAKAKLEEAATRSYTCEQCGKQFQSKNLLTRHMAVHSNSAYPCDECGASFKTRSYVKTHYRRIHILKKIAAQSSESKNENRKGRGNKRSNDDANSGNNGGNNEPVMDSLMENGIVSSFFSDNDTYVTPSPPETILCNEKDPLDCNVDEIENVLQVPTFDTFVDVSE